jgi:hypothetical protein
VYTQIQRRFLDRDTIATIGLGFDFLWKEEGKGSFGILSLKDDEDCGGSYVEFVF